MRAFFFTTIWCRYLMLTNFQKFSVLLITIFDFVEKMFCMNLMRISEANGCERCDSSKDNCADFTVAGNLLQYVCRHCSIETDHNFVNVRRCNHEGVINCQVV